MRWNSKVTERDEVFIIGDFTFGNYESAQNYFGRLAGRIYIIPSIGHDRKWVRQCLQNNEQDRLQGKVRILGNIHKVKDDGRTLILCHYPLLTWEKSFHGAIHLHGHEHGREGRMGWSNDSDKADEPAFRVDVGVDLWDFEPITLDDILRKARRMGFIRSDQ